LNFPLPVQQIEQLLALGALGLERQNALAAEVRHWTLASLQWEATAGRHCQEAATLARTQALLVETGAVAWLARGMASGAFGVEGLKVYFRALHPGQLALEGPGEREGLLLLQYKPQTQQDLEVLPFPPSLGLSKGDSIRLRLLLGR